jgi:SAM-dependent methyltransferase
MDNCTELNKIDSIYRNIPLDEIPWNVEVPPDAIVELVESGIVKPCRTIDLGCGTGNCAIYLSDRGFDVTGIDFSPTAIKIAQESAKKKGAKCTFIISDILSNLDQVKGTFDFAYDWEVLHHIFPENRDKYLENVHRILNPKGKYFSLSFCEKDPQFGGIGKYRKTPLGTVLYFSSEDELKTLFSRYFSMIDHRTIEIFGKYGPHIAIYSLMERE